jgi:putative membrane protein
VYIIETGTVFAYDVETTQLVKPAEHHIRKLKAVCDEGPFGLFEPTSGQYAMKSYQSRKGFWREAIAFQVVQRIFEMSFKLDISPFGFVGVVLGILLVIRLNAGYDRWWEARTLWGGMVNQSRNLVISAMAYGPDDTEWRERFVRWAAAFPHSARHSLRGEPFSSEVSNLIGTDHETQFPAADHMPSLVALKLGELLGEAKERFGMDGLHLSRLIENGLC